jgi:itaconyl-CoA hydratase
MRRQACPDNGGSHVQRLSSHRREPVSAAHRPGLREFAAGQRFRHRPVVTLSQQDNADEALDTQNGAMLHYDAHYAAATAWQNPLMVSTLTLQRLIGMASKTYGRRSAILGFDDIAMNGPLFGGDTLYAESEVLDVEPTGTIRTLIRGCKADGTEVARVSCRMAVERRDTGDDPVQEERFAAYHAADDGALVEQAGLWFDDCVAGESFVHAPPRTFHREESLMHAWRSLDLTPYSHVPETFVVAVATALTTRTFGRVVANLGWHDVQLPVPVAVGDTIEAESTILETRESRSRPGEGIVSVATRARNQHGVEVLSYRRSLLVYRRGATAPYARAGY